MGTIDFQQRSETFSSPVQMGRINSDARNSLSGLSACSELFGEHFSELDFVSSADMAKFDDYTDGSSSDEEIIDVEAIDELASNSPITSARTYPITALARKKSILPRSANNAPVAQPKVSKETLASVVSAGPLPTRASRNRHNSEQIVNDLVELQGVLSADIEANQTCLHFDSANITPSLPLDDLAAGNQLEADCFSLLGIDGIEAEDLNSLFEQFEATASELDSNLCSIDSLSPAQPAKPRPLSLEDYRKLRGTKSTESQEDELNNQRVAQLTPSKCPPVGNSSSSSMPTITLPTVSVMDQQTIPNVPSIQPLAAIISSTQPKKSKVDTSMMPAALRCPPAQQCLVKKSSNDRGLANKAPTMQGFNTKHSTAPGNTETNNTIKDNEPNRSVSIMKQTKSNVPTKLPLDVKTNKLPTSLLPSKLNPKVLPAQLVTQEQVVESSDMPKQISVVIPVSRGTLGANAVDLQVPAAVSKQEHLQHAVHIDHDYCEIPTESDQKRDIKAELELLLKRIPDYLNSMQAVQPSFTDTPVSLSPNSCQGCQSQSDASNKSPKSSAPAAMKPTAKPLTVGSEKLPKAYAVPTRGRPKKRKLRRKRSPSRSSSSCSSTSSSERNNRSRSKSYDSYDSDASCDYGGYSSADSCTSCSSSDRDYKRRRSSRHSKKNRKNRSKSSRSRSHKSSKHKSKRLKRHRNRRSSRSSSPYSYTTSARSRSPSTSSNTDLAAMRRKAAQEAHEKAMGERRVVYVGGISEKYTKGDLKKRFGGFGEIERVSIFLRTESENYGFVTFYSKADAYAAVEKGNDVFGPKFNLGFGGRRQFCSTTYADLDGCQAIKEEWAPTFRTAPKAEDDFDALLKTSMKKISQ